MNETNNLAVQKSEPPTKPVQLSVFSTGGDAFVTAQRMAKALSSSSMVPPDYQGDGNIGNCLIALDIANRLGASPLAIMQHMVPVHGKPAWSATFLIATVNSCGRFTPLRFEEVGEEGKDNWGFRAVARDKNTDEILRGSLISIGMAKAEGWHGRNGSKWKTMPEQMLKYRAASFWTRAYAPELSLGMQTREEVIDVVEVESAPAAEPGKRRKQDIIAMPEVKQPEDPVTDKARIEQPSAIQLVLASNMSVIPSEVIEQKRKQEVAKAETDRAQAAIEDPTQSKVTEEGQLSPLEKVERLMERDGLSYEFIQQKMAALEAYPNTERALEDLLPKEQNIIAANWRTISRVWKARKVE